MKVYRQGDVGIVPIEKIEGKPRQRDARGRIVLAYGEVTGHAHAIHDEAVESYVDEGGTLHIDAPSGANVVHEEHDTISLPPGRYRVIHQREYTPEAIRRVVD